MEDSGEKKEKLDKLEKKLYSRNAPNMINTQSSGFVEGEEEMSETGEVKENWQEFKPGSFDQLAAKFSQTAGRKHHFIKKVFVFSAIFFVLACGAAAFVFFGGANLISSKNVDIKIVGPLSIGAGQEVSFEVNVINNNRTDLESASLLIEYPDGTKSPIDLSKELKRESFPIEKIEAGKNYSQNAKAVFFGEKDSVMKMKISLEYRVENSSALFYKEKDYELSISSAPIIITPTYPKEVNSNQDISLSIEVASNSKDKVENFLVNVEYPFGFTFKSSSPEASFSNNIWKFSNIDSGEKKTIKIYGNIIGQDNEERAFKINAGTASADDERAIAVLFTKLTESVLIKKPFIGLGFFVQGSESDAAVRGGSQVSSIISIANNLSTKLYNVTAEISLTGGALDPASVAPSNGGFFQSSKNTIFWDKRSVYEFSEMDPGSGKSLSFSLTPLQYSKIKKGESQGIEMVAKINGERILESGSSEKVSVTETRKISLATDISLSSKTTRSVGNIENSGPIPPKVGIPTTYTIVWSIGNSFNQVSNVEVKATLPSYVNYAGIFSPSNEILSFNKETDEVIWNAGSILPDTGFGSSEKKVYFQLEFLPSISQLGQTPMILGEASLSGIDKKTGLKVEAKADAATINFSGDSSFRTGDERVTQ